MTISSNSRKAGPFIGNGTAATFPFTFKVFQASDLEVVRLTVATNVETVLVLGTNFSASVNEDQNSSPGGTITLTAGALAAGFNLVITSDIENLQPTDLTNQGGFYPEVITDALDRATIQIQQLQEAVDRAALLPITSSEDAASLVADIIRLADSADNLDIDATNIASINSVAGSIANVNTVATNIGNVNTVAGVSANVTTVATNVASVNTVAADLNEPVSEIETVAGSITNVNTVGTNIANVNTVAGISANVTTVAGISANVTTVASNSAAVTTVATDISAVTTVANDLNEPVSEIETVAGSIANVNTVGTNIASVNTAAGNNTNITTVATNIANVNTAATNIANVNSVAGNATNINTVASISAAVSTVSTNIVAVNSAYTNIAAIIDAPTQAANAANSAASAAASAASGMYSAVQDKSANYTILAADAGDLIRVTTTGGAVTITLPLIAGALVGDGFKIAVVKWTADANAVNITRSGSDTINGATSAQIGSQYSQIIFVADGETNTWFASQSGLGATNVNIDNFSGNGSTTAFTLTSDPSTENNTAVYISGVYQQKNTYSVSGTTLTFSTAPPSGTTNIEVAYATPLAIGTPSDGTVTNAKIVDGAVTTAKLAGGTVNTTADIGANGLTVGKGANGVTRNTAFGITALAAATGNFNTGIGNLALLTNSTGSSNTAVGDSALRLNTTGGSNTAIGQGAIESTTTGSDNAAIGKDALSSNTTGASNTALGKGALAANTTASRNTAVGYHAGVANTTGTRNVAVGAYSLNVATTGNFNTAVGDVALESLTTGSSNTAIGIGSGGAITTGSKNTIIGGYTGNQGGLDIRTLSNRIVISDGDGNPRIYVDEAGATSIRGIDLTMGGVSPSIFRNTNSGCSGFHFTQPGAFPVNGNGSLNDNVMPLGNGSYRMSVIYAGTGTISTSDQTEKQDIELLSDAELRVAKAIKGLMKKYRWKDAVAIKGAEARIHVGVIAQEVEAAFAAEGLDAHRYAMFCSDTSYKVDGQAMDADGNWHTPETEGAVKFTRLGVRYDQVLAFLIAAM